MASILLSINGGFGLICNVAVFWIFYKEKFQRTAFNLICSCRAFSNFVILSVTFLMYFVPTILVGSPTLSKSWGTYNIAFSNTIYLGSVTADMNSKNRMKKNGYLFLQTVIQDSLIVIDFIFSFKLNGLSSNRIWQFISGTFVWESIHSLDGFIMILFNERFTFIRLYLNFSGQPSHSSQQVVSLVTL
ncbi:unnamed protein product [Caenorhabditis angaria]|uniref:7TM GPCR serpentine receptor class x (Srx) domain-containing protein n=1 Tax=Caenorhabditis angaria TaxID=860376 RepID=A0A9P1N842_9PELO|nr:unnamed protein product [Caenorhabditis angaria]